MKDTFEDNYANAFELYDLALSNGWRSVHSMPLAGQGQFLALTLRGLIRVVRSRGKVRRIKRADGYGPERVAVRAVVSGNYLAAIAWKPITDPASVQPQSGQ